DQANVNSESLAVANEVINRIMRDAGFELSWIGARDILNTDGPSGNPARPNTLPTEGYFAVVITPHALEGSRETEAGFAAVASGPYRRAYVFYDRVEDFSRV